jgi:hypothetical protein
MYDDHLETATSPNVTSNTRVPLPLNEKKKSRELCMAHPGQYNYTIDEFHEAALKWLDTQSR